MHATGDEMSRLTPAEVAELMTEVEAIDAELVDGIAYARFFELRARTDEIAEAIRE